MRRHASASAVALVVTLTAAPSARAQPPAPLALSRGEVEVKPANVPNPRANGSTCVHVRKGMQNAALGGPGTSVVHKVGDDDAVAQNCAIPFGAVTYAGRGIVNQPKFPAPQDVRSIAEFFPPGALQQSAGSSFTSRKVGNDPSAFLYSRAEFRDGGGLSVARTNDPWFFTPDTDMDLTIEVLLNAAELQTYGPYSFAAIRASAQFGAGSLPGSGVLATAVFHDAISGTGAHTLPTAVALMDQTFSLTRGQSYWLTADVESLASTVPEPASLGLLGGGLLGVVAVAALRRRGTALAGRERA